MKLSTAKRLLQFVLLFAISISAHAQMTISGKVTDANSGEELIGVNVLVKGTVLGTITDVQGRFDLSIHSNPPITLVISSVGYERQEIEIDQPAINNLQIKLTESMMLGQEVVVSASRVEENILKSPVSIEKMDLLAVQNSSSDDYYKSIANLKGVDMTSSSINFQIINARGFNSTGNTRFVQLTDGMDTQAPALNFPIGNLNGPSTLDVESVEMIPGAASALYGPNAFNGVLLVNSKNPFEYQGLSAYYKQGVNHIGKSSGHSPSPMYEGAIRYAKAFNNKFAFKVNASYSRAQDWHATSAIDRNANLQPNGFPYNPGSDKLNYMGDEASLNMNILRFSANSASGPGWQTQASKGDAIFAPGVTAWDYAQNGFLPSQVVSAPAYSEKYLVNYNAKNLKANVGLFYRINDKLELSYMYNGGFGTSVYTGAQRYSLVNFGIGQHRLQLRGDNFFIRSYTTRERSGDSYIAEFLGKRVNDVRFGGDVSNYLINYPVYYLQYLYNQGYDVNSDPSKVSLQDQINASNYAQQTMLGKYPLTPGSDQFNKDKAQVQNGVIPKGPLFADKSNMYHNEFQYNFKNEIKFMDLMVGGSFRIFQLNSGGTIFADGENSPYSKKFKNPNFPIVKMFDLQNSIFIKEYGAYVQGSKELSDNFKLSGSVRYDKNQNFYGQVNPRISAVYTVNKNHNFRASFQTGFRNPTTQGQYISLNIISARLLGGLPQFYNAYDLTQRSSTGVPLAFDGGSVEAFRKAVFSGKSPYDPSVSSLLKPFTSYNAVRPERVKSMEIGYRSLIANKLMVDFEVYNNFYTHFITQIRVVKASELTSDAATAVNGSTPGANLKAGDPNYASMLNGTSDNTFQVYTNLNSLVQSRGAALGLTYMLQRGYRLSGNYSWNKLLSGGFTENTLAMYNTPQHKFNVSFSNRQVIDNLGFNVTYRWQTSFLWQSSFAVGNVPAYGTLDAQFTYKLPKMKSSLRLGGSNLLNHYYIQSLGGPRIGAIYYVSITFDDLLH